MAIISAILIFSLLFVAPASAQLVLITPSIKDPDFTVETFVTGIDSPTTMAFVDDHDILVLQKNDGQVRLIRDGVLQPAPVLDASVTNVREQGMLGIAAVNSTVYLYFTESTEDGGEPIGRRVYKYDWTGSELANPALVRDWNSTQAYHNGGTMAAAPDGTVYIIIGDTGRYGQLQNHGPGSTFYPDTSVIMPVVPEGPYYAMGVRNSFGLAFDPYTGNMWNTENGNEEFDEINLVEPYTNGGWELIMGPATEEQLARLPAYHNYTYRDPVFSWEAPVAPTALSFVRSEPLAKFNDSLFVGDCNTGTLYRFTLNQDRNGFAFDTPVLADDKIANREDPVDEIVFGQDFICITDIKVGPDGFLYIASLSQNAIFRVVPSELASGQLTQLSVVQIAIYAGMAIAAGVTVHLTRRYLRNKSRSSRNPERP